MKKMIQIYLAEDDEDDATFFQLAFMKAFRDIQVNVYANGEELLKDIYSSETLPSYIFLDINMPVMNGLETLVNLKASRQTALIPTFMFSSSDYPENIHRSYELGATSYFTKPNSYTDILRLSEIFKAYWNSVTTMPLEK